MKGFMKFLGFMALIGFAMIAIRLLRQNRADSVFEMGSTSSAVGGSGSGNGQRRGISPELLEILADPADKGPVELMTDVEGKEWLINRRNGFRYPVEDGIPIMLIEEGEKYKDESLITN